VLGQAVSHAERWWYLILISYVTLGAGVLAIKAPTLVLAIWLVLVPWTWTFPIRSAKYYFSFDLLALTLVTLVIVARTLARRRPIPAFYPPEWLFCLATAYLNVWPIVEARIRQGAWGLGTFGDVWKLLLVPTVAYFVFRETLETRRDIRIILYAFVAVGLVWTVSGFYEHYTGFQWHSALTGRKVPLIWKDVGKGRALGAAYGQAQAGVVLTAALLVLMHIIGFVKRTAGKLLCYAAAVGMLMAVFFTYTRGSYGGFVVGLLAMVAIARGRRTQYGLYASILALIIVLMAPKLLGEEKFFTRITNPENYYGRLAMSKTAFNIFKDHFWFGAGDLRDQTLLFRYVSSMKHPGGRGGKPYYYPDNDYLVVLAQHGVIGFVIYYGAVLGFAVLIFRIRNDLRGDGLLGVNLASTVLAYAVVVFFASFITQLRTEPYIYYLFFALLALVVRSKQIQDQEERLSELVRAPAFEASTPGWSFGGQVPAGGRV